MTTIQSTLSIHDSMRELLATASESDDCTFLLPVIENLFEQINTIDGDAENAYRQVINNLSSLLIENNVLSDEGKKHFEWLVKFSQSGHDANVLEALMQRFDSSLFKTRPDTEEPPSTKPSVAVSESAAGSGKTKKTDAEINLDFLQSINNVNDLNSPHFHELLKENHVNDDEIKTLKDTLTTRLESTKSQFHEFENVMQLLLADLQEANDSNELESIRSMLNRSISNLLSEQSTISNNIIDVARELDLFESHCKHLNHELGLVKRLSMTDELTRLPNRRAFLKRLENESGRVQRYGYPMAIAMIDLDLFKEINDNYGHAIGDQVLQSYTKHVLSTFRNYDLVARYGGEEFAVLLPHTDIFGAERALNKVLQKASETPLDREAVDAPVKLPTFSAGVTAYQQGESIDNIINRADKAMYNAKRLGRNRVVVEA
ncbi:MAG: GGDEF domain-containing protein [Gammaproteobacteria bacterium]|nr:GGDEF domain-containing protein [Gammaproteobacteria bacterium]